MDWPPRIRRKRAGDAIVGLQTLTGGLFLGVFTATEAGVAGMFAALLFGTIHRLRSGATWLEIGVMLRDSIIGTLTGTASVFLLIIGVAALTRAMALSRVPNGLAMLIVDLGLIFFPGTVTWLPGASAVS